MAGVAFSEHAEPQFSVNLKQQIDSFVSRHRSRLLRDKASSLPGQTLGSAADIALHLSSTKAPGELPLANIHCSKEPYLARSATCISLSQTIVCPVHDDRQVLGRTGLNECGVRY